MQQLSAKMNIPIRHYEPTREKDDLGRNSQLLVRVFGPGGTTQIFPDGVNVDHKLIFEVNGHFYHRGCKDVFGLNAKDKVKYLRLAITGWVIVYLTDKAALNWLQDARRSLSARIVYYRHDIREFRNRPFPHHLLQEQKLGKYLNYLRHGVSESSSVGP